MNKMHLSYAAFVLKAAAVGYDYHKKDSEPSNTEIKETQDKILKSFEAFKEKNDDRLKDLEKRGAEDPVAREQVEKITEEIKGLKEIREKLEKLAKQSARPGGGEGEGQKHTAEQVEHKKAFEAYIRNPSSEKARADLETAQQKAVDTTTDASGGFAVPEIISSRVERELKEISPLRGIVDTQQAGSKDFKILVDVNGASYGWVGETDARSGTDTPSLEEVAPTFGMIYAYPKASEESLEDMFFNVENWLVQAMLEGFAEGEEAAIVNGNGVKKPTGILHGTPTNKKDGARDFGVLQFIASGAAAGFAAEDPGDAFMSLVYSLKKGYRRNARWMFNKMTAGETMKLKDGQGNYLWQPSVVAGQPDKLMGYPVTESEEMPDIGAGTFPISFGDFKAGYVLCDLVGLRLTKDEITEPGYVKWYARRRMGGKLKKSEAIKLMKMAA
ncbi:phage major capsid protein [Pseudovibrio ascidiaceicola]|uniref:phage major capsid protein n=1 Tax=Pseudovibrio ascidiaceicola TaxID=285279 RepID=UPI003D3658FD